MKYAFLVSLLAAFSVHAELYRWVDPQTGSVKFSNLPPPWFGDPEKERRAPRVELIPYRAPGAPPKPGAPAASEAQLSLVAGLEARWTALLQFFNSLPPGADFAAARSAIQQQLAAYQAVTGELDRLDPAGASRRRNQEDGVVEAVRRGLEAQLQAQPRQ